MIIIFIHIKMIFIVPAGLKTSGMLMAAESLYIQGYWRIGEHRD